MGWLLFALDDDGLDLIITNVTIMGSISLTAEGMLEVKEWFDRWSLSKGESIERRY